ncbi:MAG: TetR family transcriptional regulator [Pseudomonadota bacterium]
MRPVMSEIAKETPQAADIRQAILGHATDLFHHYGFNKTNMADIASRAEMSTANLYRYFKNKQAIGLACVACYFEGERAATEAALQAVDPARPEERIRAVIRTAVRHIVDAMEAQPKMIELAEFVSENPEGWALLQQLVVWRRRVLIAEIERGNAAGVFDVADPERTAIALQHAIKAFHMPFSLARWKDKSTIDPELESVLDLVFQGIRSKR